MWDLPGVASTTVVEVETNCPLLPYVLAQPDNRRRLADLGFFNVSRATRTLTGLSSPLASSAPIAAFHVYGSILRELVRVKEALRAPLGAYLARLR